MSLDFAKAGSLNSKTFDEICEAISQGRVHVSEHAYDEAVDDDLSIVDVIERTPHGEVVDDYRNDPRGRSCLVLLRVEEDKPVHGVWAFDDGARRAILVTVYRPDPARWTDDFRQRRTTK